MSFNEEKIKSWEEFLEFKKTELSGDWVYRGQGKDYPLTTSLERSKEYFDVGWSDLPGIEEQMIRNYRRSFQGERDDYLDKDKLYCISLMQHHGAPTRLLDFTWSLYIGAFFALENAHDSPVLWCINPYWINSEVKKVIGKDLSIEREVDNTRTDESFDAIYMSEPPKKFVHLENPIRLNTRIVIQQGIFLCPGDVSSPLEDNLKELNKWNDSKHILKIFFDFTKSERKSVLKELHRMNITRASLFPGLEGYSQSMKQLIPLFKHMSDKKAGKGRPFA